MELKLKIKDITGTQMAAKITGTFEVDAHIFKFTAIAFGRIGGQNIGAKLSKNTENKLESLGYDVNAVIDGIQKNLIQGNLTLPEGLSKDMFSDD